MINCREDFLKDIVQVDVFAAGEPSFVIPCTVPNVSSFRNVALPTSLLKVAYTDGEDGEESNVMAREKTISVKQTSQQNGGNLIYIYDVNATIEGDLTPISTLLPRITGKDCNVVLTNAEGKKLLLYALPNTFSFTKTDTNNKEVALKIGVKSVSDYIELT